MAKQLHAHYVDKRLSMARQLLSLISNDSTSSLQEGCCDAVLLQSYFALLHYVNELLVIYHRPVIEIDQHNCLQLSDIIASENHVVTELKEFKQLMNQPTSWLSVIVQQPRQMLKKATHSPANANEKKSAITAQELTLVEVVDEGSSVDVSIERVSWVVNECSVMIQRQREHLIEY